MLKFLAQIDITHVPYRGTGPATTDLLAGTVSMALDTMSILLPPSRTGNLRALAVTTPERSRQAPDIPALAETLPGFDAAPFNYIAAPAGTPVAVIARLNGVIVAILNDPAYRARMVALGEEADTLHAGRACRHHRRRIRAMETGHRQRGNPPRMTEPVLLLSAIPADLRAALAERFTLVEDKPADGAAPGHPHRRDDGAGWRAGRRTSPGCPTCACCRARAPGWNASTCRRRRGAASRSPTPRM